MRCWKSIGQVVVHVIGWRAGKDTLKKIATSNSHLKPQTWSRQRRKEEKAGLRGGRV